MKVTKRKKIFLGIIVGVMLVLALVSVYGFYDGRQVSEETIYSTFVEYMPHPYKIEYDQGNPQVVFRESCTYSVATHISSSTIEGVNEYNSLLDKLESAGWHVEDRDKFGHQSEATKNNWLAPDMKAIIYANTGDQPGVEFRFIKNYKDDCL